MLWPRYRDLPLCVRRLLAGEWWPDSCRGLTDD
jgi:hypothetical protein